MADVERVLHEAEKVVEAMAYREQSIEFFRQAQEMLSLFGTQEYSNPGDNIRRTTPWETVDGNTSLQFQLRAIIEGFNLVNDRISLFARVGETGGGVLFCETTTAEKVLNMDGQTPNSDDVADINKMLVGYRKHLQAARTRASFKIPPPDKP